MQQRMWMRVLLVLMLVASTVTLEEEAAQAAETVEIVALGDSYTSGTGALDYEDKTCWRSANAYVHRYANELRKKGLSASSYNYACHGNWTYDVPGQIAAAGERLKNADIVFMTIGGNDAAFKDLVVNCIAFTREFNKCDDNYIHSAAQLDGIEYRTRNLIFDINRLAPHAQIVMVGYPYLAASCAETIKMVRSLQSAADIRMSNMVRSLDQIPLATAGRVNYVSMLAPFTGHEVCGDGPQYIRGSLDTAISNYSEWWHPNREGHQHMANVLVQANIHKKVIAPTDAVSGEQLYRNLPLACGTSVWRATTYDTYNHNGTVFHHGHAVDLPVRDGTVVVAPSHGTVYVKWDAYGYGRYIDLVDDSGLVHRMAHLRERVDVANGQRVSQGQALGLVGVTGATTGPHLHYEQRNAAGMVAMQLDGPALSWSAATTSDGDRYTLHSLKSANCGGSGTSVYDTPLIHLQSGGVMRVGLPNGQTKTMLSGIMTPNYRVSCDQDNNGQDETYSVELRNNKWHIMQMKVVNGVGQWSEWRTEFYGKGIRGLSCGDRNGDGKDELKLHLSGGGEIWAVSTTGHSRLVTGISTPFARVECDTDRDGRDEMISLERAGTNKWRLMIANFNSNGSFHSWERFMPDSRLSGHDLTNMSCGDYNGDGIAEVKLFSRSSHTMYRVSSHGNPSDRVLATIWSGLTTPSFMVECDINGDGNDEIYSVEDRAEGLFIMQGQLRPDKVWRVFSTDFSGKAITDLSCGRFDLY